MRKDLGHRIRDRIVGALHLGYLHTGDRLPSIREVASEFGVNFRTAAKAYRMLEEEGLVEIRGRSGVFVAQQEHLGREMLPETARWLAGVLVDAHHRRLRIPELHELVRQCTTAVPVRCALVESVVDTMVAFGAELEEEWGFDLRRVRLELPDHGEDDGLTEEQAEALRETIRGAHLVAVTSFLAPLVRPLAEEVDRPLVLLTIHEELERAVHRHLDEAGRLVVVAVDPRFVERVKHAYGSERVRGVPVHDRRALAELDPAEPVLLTRAAHERLGPVDLSLVFPHSPTMSLETDRELADILVRTSLEG